MIKKLEPCHIHVLLEQNIPNYINVHHSSIIDSANFKTTLCFLMVESAFTSIFVNTLTISFYSHFYTCPYISIYTRAIANASYLCGNLWSAGQPIYLNKSMEVFKRRCFFYLLSMPLREKSPG